MIKTKYVLHLPSWYPSEADQFNGDFIERHINLLQFVDFENHVIYVTEHPDLSKHVVSEMNGIITNIFYFKSRNSDLLNYQRKISIYLKEIKRYFRRFGRPSLTHNHVVLVAGFITYWLKVRFGIPYIITEHSTVYHSSHRIRYEKVLMNLTKLVAKNASYILPVSKNLMNQMKAVGIGGNFKVISNVVPDYFIPETKVRTSSKKRILHISSFNDKAKNITGILETIARIALYRKDFEVSFVGSDNISKIRKMVEKRNLKEVVSVEGPIEHIDIPAKFQSCDIFLLFSNYENQPCVILESLMMGVPVVSSDVGGIKELIIDNENGIIVQKGKQDELENAICYMLDNLDTFKQDSITEIAMKKYGREKVRDDILDVYSEFIK